MAVLCRGVFATAEQRRPNTGDGVLALGLGYSLCYLVQRDQERIRVLTEAWVRAGRPCRGADIECERRCTDGVRGRGDAVVLGRLVPKGRCTVDL